MYIYEAISFVQNDGGRAVAGFRGNCGDCGVRAVAIVADVPYLEVYKLGQQLKDTVKLPKRKRATKHKSVRDGLHKEVMDKLMEHYGFVWVPTMQIGSGCKVHLHQDELPAGRIVCRLSKHYCAVIHGELHDTYDCSREGTRCVYGYWA